MFFVGPGGLEQKGNTCHFGGCMLARLLGELPISCRHGVPCPLLRVRAKAGAHSNSSLQIMTDLWRGLSSFDMLEANGFSIEPIFFLTERVGFQRWVNRFCPTLRDFCSPIGHTEGKSDIGKGPLSRAILLASLG